MEFNQIVKEYLAPTLFRYGFRIAEEYNDYIRFESDYIIIITAYVKLENYSSLSIGRKGHEIIVLDAEIVEHFFPYDLPISIETMNRFENFAFNVNRLFEGSGKQILNGDLSKMIAIEEYSYKRAKAYNDELIHRQDLKSADLAWEKQDYATFLKYLDIINVDTLPGSYKLKQNIARKKLNNQ